MRPRRTASSRLAPQSSSNAAPSSRIALTEPELVAWGESFGRAAHAPLIVTIRGDLGAGKTTLTRAICRGLGVGDEVTSPTYAIVHQYSGRTPVYHLDLYRLAGPADLTNIGWDDIMSSGGVAIVEWPERAGAALPPDHIPLALEHIPGDDARRVLLAG